MPDIYVLIWDNENESYFASGCRGLSPSREEAGVFPVEMAINICNAACKSISGCMTPPLTISSIGSDEKFKID
jgi:hypothetical protein